MDVLSAPAPGRQFLPEIPFPSLTVGKTYRVFLRRPIRTRRGRIQHRVVHFRAILRGIHSRAEGCADYEFICTESSDPNIIGLGYTYFLPFQSGLEPDWRACEVDPRPFA
jgi:hypothetical protein